MVHKREPHVHVLMADLMPKVEDVKSAPRPWAPVRGGVACPQCDLRNLFRRTDGSGIVMCHSCRAQFVGELAEEIRDLPEPTALDWWHPPIVYYMRMSTLVKIGTSTNIRARVEAIGPQGVIAVEAGDYALEAARHQQFVQHHSHREWFHLADELAEHVAALRQAWHASTGQTTEEWLTERGVRV